MIPHNGRQPLQNHSDDSYRGILYRDPWADPKSRSTLGFQNLHHRTTGVQHWRPELGVLLSGYSRGSGYLPYYLGSLDP